MISNSIRLKRKDTHSAKLYPNRNIQDPSYQSASIVCKDAQSGLLKPDKTERIYL